MSNIKKFTDEELNNEHKIKTYVTNFDRLHHIINERSRMHVILGKELNLIRLNDAVYFNNVGTITRKTINYVTGKENDEELSPADVPINNTECPICKSHFKLTDIATMVIHKDNKTGKRTFYHNRCSIYKSAEDFLNEVKNIFNSIMVPVRPVYRAISNKDDDMDMTPWYEVSTCFGKIVIGKNITGNRYQIMWDKKFMKFDISVFADCDTRKKFDSAQRWIHAQSPEVCSDYIERSILSIIDKRKVREIYVKNNRIFNSLSD